jgi:hypothetical protein
VRNSHSEEVEAGRIHQAGPQSVRAHFWHLLRAGVVLQSRLRSEFVLLCSKFSSLDQPSALRLQVPVENQTAWDVIISLIFVATFFFIGYHSIREFMDMRRGILPKLEFD